MFLLLVLCKHFVGTVKNKLSERMSAKFMDFYHFLYIDFDPNPICNELIINL